MEQTRLIVFLELVDGCKNKKCPSWGSVCTPRSQNFMSEETLNRVISEMKQVFDAKHPFEVIDLWTYGNGDSLDHPELEKMLWIIKKELGHYAKISMAIDSSRKNIACHWWRFMDKVKIIHKQPASDWIGRAYYWRGEIDKHIPMSHKLITNHISKEMWDTWKRDSCLKELKAVPWHNIKLGTDNPIFTQRESFTFEPGVPVERGPYPGRPVRRSLIKWDGGLRRCLVSPTQKTTIKDLFLTKDDVCPTCWPLTGSELVKFYEDKIVVTSSANCVSDGYFIPTW